MGGASYVTITPLTTLLQKKHRRFSLLTKSKNEQTDPIRCNTMTSTQIQRMARVAQGLPWVPLGDAVISCRQARRAKIVETNPVCCNRMMTREIEQPTVGQDACGLDTREAIKERIDSHRESTWTVPCSSGLAEYRASARHEV